MTSKRLVVTDFYFPRIIRMHLAEAIAVFFFFPTLKIGRDNMGFQYWYDDFSLHGPKGNLDGMLGIKNLLLWMRLKLARPFPAVGRFRCINFRSIAVITYFGLLCTRI